MAYTDYLFYTTKYFGNVIPESDFPRWEDRASDKLNLVTFDRLGGELPEGEKLSTKVQKTVCAMAELLYRIDNIESSSGVDIATGQGKQVKSISAGAESISYGIGESAINTIAKDKTEQDKAIYNIAVEYLSGTGLLYAGL